MTEPRRPPHAKYGPQYDGAADPERIRPTEAHFASRERLIEERRRRRSLSPVVRKLHAVNDRALGRRLR